MAKISDIPVSEVTALSDTDIHEGEEAGGTSFKFAFSVLKSTLKTYFDTLYPGYSLLASGAVFNPADATTYYIGKYPTLTPITTANLRPVVIQRAGTITRVDISWLMTTSYGTAEASSMWLRLNNTTDTLLSAAFDFSANGLISVTGLSIAVVAGNKFEIKWTTPTWVTNPVALYLNAQVFVSA